MKPGISRTPPSRRNKKQIAAFLDADLVAAVHARRKDGGLTQQEIVAEGVNRALRDRGRQPMLEVRRDRLVRRSKAPSRVQERGSAPECRVGKRRVAAWFEGASVDRLRLYCRESGEKIESLVEDGLRAMLGDAAGAAAA